MHVYGKLFLPLELHSKLRSLTKAASQYTGLYSQSNFITIKWTDHSLKQLLRQRLQFSTTRTGPRYTSLDQLAEEGLPISQKIIAAAKGSPRRMLELINRLITIHAERQTSAPRFTYDDWEQLHSELRGT
jgi:hypothetical protein